ncbi:hypothetical protein [Ulvibacterium sp.]|uniref:hypothetical protein n=1 Tax=Ulvibacterium sp. TaxID=2665914 RepID=UPI003BAAD1C6
MDTFREVKKENEIKYNNWNSHLQNTRDRTNYAIRRMDLLTISISGAGIYIVFETLKFFKGEGLEVVNPSLLTLIGIAFLLAIAANFSSQITGFFANNYEERYVLLVLEELSEKEFDKDKMDDYDSWVQIFNKATQILNVASVLCMFIGLVCLFIFYYHYLF